MIFAASFSDFVLGIHIVAVVIGFGVTFAYPILFTVVTRSDARALPALHRAQHVIGQRLITPALGVILIAGIYLASHEHQWSKFYVAWGLVAALALGALGGAFFSPRENRLIELADRDVAAAGDGPVTLSPEYQQLNASVARIGALASLLVLITVIFMALHLGA